MNPIGEPHGFALSRTFLRPRAGALSLNGRLRRNLIVAAALVIGSIPALLGLVVVMPVLGHATWHLYRKVVPR